MLFSVLVTVLPTEDVTLGESTEDVCSAVESSDAADGEIEEVSMTDDVSAVLSTDDTEDNRVDESCADDESVVLIVEDVDVESDAESATIDVSEADIDVAVD